MKTVVTTGPFDNLRSGDYLFLDRASALGELHVLAWDDQACEQVLGEAPKFPREERKYLLQAIRYISGVSFVSGAIDPDALPVVEGLQPAIWVVRECDRSEAKRAYCAERGMEYVVIEDAALKDFPASPQDAPVGRSTSRKIIVTGCYDWFHSGHVAFFEEVSGHGDLYVVVGHDANIELLKGKGHPLIPEKERRYVVQSIRYVKQALISTGHGWMDAEPEIEKLKPDAYAVNEDGDVPEKREFCAKHNLEYIVLERVPKEGLPKRESTALRGF